MGAAASLTSERYSVTLGPARASGPFEFWFSLDFRELYAAAAQYPAKQPPVIEARGELQQELWVEFSLLLDRANARASVYIPSGRAFFTDTTKAVSALQSPGLDPITKRFAGQVTWDSRWKVGLMTTGLGNAEQIEKEMKRIGGGAIANGGGKPIFVSSEGRQITLPLLSSGTSELLPMFQVLNYRAWHQEHFCARDCCENDVLKPIPSIDLS